MGSVHIQTHTIYIYMHIHLKSVTKKGDKWFQRGHIHSSQQLAGRKWILSRSIYLLYFFVFMLENKVAQLQNHRKQSDNLDFLKKKKSRCHLVLMWTQVALKIRMSACLYFYCLCVHCGTASKCTWSHTLTNRRKFTKAYFVIFLFLPCLDEKVFI